MGVGISSGKPKKLGSDGAAPLGIETWLTRRRRTSSSRRRHDVVVRRRDEWERSRMNVSIPRGAAPSLANYLGFPLLMPTPFDVE